MTEAAPRLQPDGVPLQRIVTGLLLALALAGLAAGWTGLAWAGQLAGMPGALRHLAPVIVDGALVVMTLAAVARRGRGETARWMWTTVGALVVGSSAAQVAHALETTVAVGPVQLGVAVTVGALPPVVVLVATHAWLDLAVAGAPTKARRTRAAAAPKPSRSLAPQAAPAPVKATAVKPVAPRPPVAADARERVLELRAQGQSFAAISAETGVPLSTAKRWVQASEAA